jgi:hypothetical protein
MKHTGIALLLALLFSSFILPGGEEWKLEKNEGGLAVYTRKAAGSGYKELRAVTTFNSSLTGLVALIRDIPSAPSYVYKCKNAYVVRNVSESELFYYQETELQWPVHNRDVVIHYTMSQDKKSKVLVIVSEDAKGMIKEFDGKVRIPSLRGKWTFTPNRNGTVSGEYILFVHPGESIPDWVANLFLVEGPFRTIQRMRELVKEQKYQQKKYAFVQN